jgi:UDP-glucose:(heptosyl)LPS alpha-1,3-glucosyltransferase
LQREWLSPFLVVIEVDVLSPKLKIAIVMDRFLPARGGESYFSWLADELSKRGHDVHVFARKIEKGSMAEYQIHLIPVWKFPQSLRLLSFLFQSNRVLKPYHFDIIHGVGWSLAMNVFNPHGGVEKAYRKQDFLSITNRFYYAFKFLKRYLSSQSYLKVWIQKRQYLSGRVKKIIAISQMVKEYYGVPEEKIAVVFNCVDLDRFHPRNREKYRGQKRKALGIGENTLLLLFAGNNFRLKGLEPLLRALVLLRKWFPNQPSCLLIAGRGQKGRYLRKARELKASDLIIFLGSVKGMEQYYATSDIYVHPTFYDSCSLTILEALASGLPVVTSRFNGAADIITSDKGGKVIENPADPASLARAISYYFDENRRNEARIVARQWIEKYPPSYNVEETLRVYYEVADKGNEKMPDN